MEKVLRFKHYDFFDSWMMRFGFGMMSNMMIYLMMIVKFDSWTMIFVTCI